MRCFFCLTIFLFYFIRIWEDEVHVTTRCSDTEMEPLYHEAGAFRGGHTGEQQRRWAQGEGLCLFYVLLLKTIFFFSDSDCSFFSAFSSVKWVTFPLKTWTLQRLVRCSNIFLFMVCCFILSSFFSLTQYSFYLCRAEEHFLVIFLCWRSSRIWTGTQRSLL